MKLVYSTVRVPEPSAKQALPAAAAASGFRRPPVGPPRCSATERKQCPITHVQAAPGRRARSRSTAPAAVSGDTIGREPRDSARRPSEQAQPVHRENCSRECGVNTVYSRHWCVFTLYSWDIQGSRSRAFTELYSRPVNMSGPHSRRTEADIHA